MEFFAGIAVVGILLIVFIIGLAFGALGAEEGSDDTKLEVPPPPGYHSRLDIHINDRSVK